MHTSMFTRSLLIASFLFTQPACSALFVQTGPDQCTDSYAAPVVDTLLAATYLVAGATLLAQDGGSFSVDDRDFGGIGVATGVAFAGSAAHGYQAVGACRDRKASKRADPSL
jgi:hypothetical protein